MVMLWELLAVGVVLCLGTSRSPEGPPKLESPPACNITVNSEISSIAKFGSIAMSIEYCLAKVSL